MTTSPRTLLTSAISEDQPLTPLQYSYFRARLRARMHETILSLFQDRKKEGLTRSELAKRLGKAPEQVTRWLASPGNLRLDTVSDLLLAMKHELSFEATPVELTTRQNRFHDLASITPTTTGTMRSAAITVHSRNFDPETNAYSNAH